MLYNDEREIVAINKWHHAIQAVYRGARLVWIAVRSCFGSGVWIDEKPWLDDEPWRD